MNIIIKKISHVKILSIQINVFRIYFSVSNFSSKIYVFTICLPVRIEIYLKKKKTTKLTYLLFYLDITLKCI